MNPGDEAAAYAAIRATEAGVIMTIDVNDMQPLGRAVMDALFPNGTRVSTDPMPEMFLELNGKRYRFKMGPIGMDTDYNVIKLHVEAYGGSPCDDDQ